MRNIANDMDYKRFRELLEAKIIPENLVKTYTEFPGKYHEIEDDYPDFKDIKLVIENYQVSEKSTMYSKCIIYKDDKQVCDVIRNYSHFPYLLIKHSNGKRYLLCGEDYQGFTIVNLDTGDKSSFVPTDWHNGAGLCTTEFNSYSDYDNKLSTNACVWGGDEYCMQYDVADIEKFPWVVTHRYCENNSPMDGEDDEDEE